MSDFKINYDYIIVGQGLAGTLLTHFLIKNKESVLVIDPAHQNAASTVAAGIINPITGRRYVKSWRIDELLPFANQVYQEIEQELNTKIFYDLNILRCIYNHREEQDWYARTLEEGYKKYIVAQPNPADFAGHTDTVYRYAEMTHCARVDIGNLVLKYRAYLISKDVLKTERFDYQQLILQDEGIEYKGLKVKKIIFCEGQRATLNPFFDYLPFQVAKGEVFIIRIPEANFGKIFKHRVFIVPIGDDLYWVGATYDWTFENDQPTTAGKQFLEDRLNDILKVPFEIVEHRAAIRPTVKDRRPMLGSHPDFPQLAIFNGLGTKGASLAPFFAQQMTAYLTKGEALDPDVDISRIATH